MLGLPNELQILISTDNPTTYYKLLQTSKIFHLDTDTMKAKFIRKHTYTDDYKCVIVMYSLPNDWLHNCNDQPAIISDYDQYWYTDDKKHRDNDLPAEVYTSGDQRWYINDKLHRDNDQPAEIWANGMRRWYYQGKLHRDNDQPAEIWANGMRRWYNNGVQYFPIMSADIISLQLN